MLAALLLLALLFFLLGVFTTLKWLIIVAVALAIVGVIRGFFSRTGGSGY